ncbi:MAG TPA: alpha/beta hydrolase [Bryobacteraceae bacterium]|nr:alpha/beta hydrolase [Bryobacteraceae bacterium]
MPSGTGWAITIACTFLVLIALLYYLAGRVLYQPSKYPDGDWDAQRSLAAADAWMETSDGVKIHGWWIERRGSPFATLFLHGNAANLTYRAARLKEIAAAGSSVLILDYRGYGKSEGRPSEEGLYRDSEAGFIYLLGKGYRAEQIILHGESLGTAVAVDLAARRPCAGLILEAPFTSAGDVAATVVPYLGPLLVRSFNSLPKIRWIRVPKLFIHGDRDDVVPLRLGQKLFAASQGAKTFWLVPGAGHNDILQVAGAEYRQRLETFYESLLRNSAPRI